MVSKATLINAFNTKFEEFIQDLIRVFPSDEDFKTFKSGFSMLKLMDERKPQFLFHKFIPGFKPHVLARNEAFFLENDYSDILHQTGQEMDVTGELVKKLKSYWSNLSSDNKDFVWKYLLLLVSLDDKITSL